MSPPVVGKMTVYVIKNVPAKLVKMRPGDKMLTEDPAPSAVRPQYVVSSVDVDAVMVCEAVEVRMAYGTPDSKSATPKFCAHVPSMVVVPEAVCAKRET